jgi:hypothetical protein
MTTVEPFAEFKLFSRRRGRTTRFDCTPSSRAICISSAHSRGKLSIYFLTSIRFLTRAHNTWTDHHITQMVAAETLYRGHLQDSTRQLSEDDLLCSGRHCVDRPTKTGALMSVWQPYVQRVSYWYRATQMKQWLASGILASPAIWDLVF